MINDILGSFRLLTSNFFRCRNLGRSCSPDLFESLEFSTGEFEPTMGDISLLMLTINLGSSQLIVSQHLE